MRSNGSCAPRVAKHCPFDFHEIRWQPLNRCLVCAVTDSASPQDRFVITREQSGSVAGIGQPHRYKVAFEELSCRIRIVNAPIGCLPTLVTPISRRSGVSNAAERRVGCFVQYCDAGPAEGSQPARIAAVPSVEHRKTPLHHIQRRMRRLGCRHCRPGAFPRRRGGGVGRAGDPASVLHAVSR